MSRRRALSYVEILVVLGLLSLLFGFLRIAGSWRSASLEAMEKTDLTARLRNSAVLLGRLLSQSTSFLHPGQVSGEFVSLLVFRTRDNEIGAIHVDERGGLRFFNYSTGTSFLILSAMETFQARLVRPGLLEYRLSVKDGDFRVMLENQLSTSNSLP